MNRRGFLGALLTATAGVAVSSLDAFGLDPERALWVPGQKTFFLPSGRLAVMTDSPEVTVLSGGRGFIFDELITQEAFAVLQRNLAFSKLVNREYDASFIARGSLKRPVVGEKVTVSLPVRYA